MMENSRRKPTGFVGVVVITLLLFVCALILNITLVYTVWNGDAEQFARDVVEREYAMLGLSESDQAKRLVEGNILAARNVFVMSGMENWLIGGGQDELTTTLWPVYQTIIATAMLYVERLTVLLLAAPFFLLAVLLGAVDGAVAWYLRRLEGGRESAFLYHRAKYAISFGLMALLVVYLLPPFALDPRLILPPFLLFYALVSRIVVSRFKKYI